MPTYESKIWIRHLETTQLNSLPRKLEYQSLKTNLLHNIVLFGLLSQCTDFLPILFLQTNRIISSFSTIGHVESIEFNWKSFSPTRYDRSDVYCTVVVRNTTEPTCNTVESATFSAIFCGKYSLFLSLPVWDKVTIFVSIKGDYHFLFLIFLCFRKTSENNIYLYFDF